MIDWTHRWAACGCSSVPEFLKPQPAVSLPASVSSTLVRCERCGPVASHPLVPSCPLLFPPLQALTPEHTSLCPRHCLAFTPTRPADLGWQWARDAALTAWIQIPGCILVHTRKDASFRSGGASGEKMTIPGSKVLSSSLLNRTRGFTTEMAFHSGSRMRTCMFKIKCERLSEQREHYKMHWIYLLMDVEREGENAAMLG